MQIKRLVIENFRGIEKFERDFVDDFGNPAKVILIVGPNSSGKTSILDAIWFSLMSEMGYPLQRENFRPEKEFIVRTGENFARVVTTITISNREKSNINQWKQELVKQDGMSPVSDIRKNETVVDWTYPAQFNYRDSLYGGYIHTPTNGWLFLRGRRFYKRLSDVNAQKIQGRDDVGSIYFFEQERRILSNPVKNYSSAKSDDTDNEANEIDIRSMLIDFGVKDKFGNYPNREKSWYRQIQQGFNEICTPHTMGEIYTLSSDGEFEIDFRDGNKQKYTFDGLSSGQRSVLNFLVHYTFKRMFNSVVLIDELEMHLHPTWQRHIFNYLRNRDDGNQFIITTHSPTLAMYVPDEHIINLGDLDERIPVRQYENNSEDDNE
ncbi:MAG: AAA family ATPase [Anaerolineae bacterium]|jgi:predicted ATPase|nr:AAA family ATPase [Anaerolineae bacterium]